MAGRLLSIGQAARLLRVSTKTLTRLFYQRRRRGADGVWCTAVTGWNAYGRPICVWKGDRRYFEEDLLAHIPIWTVGVAARKLGLHPNTGRAWVRAGKLEIARREAGGRDRVSPAAVARARRWLRGRRSGRI